MLNIFPCVCLPLIYLCWYFVFNCFFFYYSVVKALLKIILDTILLPNVCFIFKYFSQCVASVSIFLIVSLKELKILIFMQTVHYNKVWLHFFLYLLTAFMLLSYLSAFCPHLEKQVRNFWCFPIWCWQEVQTKLT